MIQCGNSHHDCFKDINQKKLLMDQMFMHLVKLSEVGDLALRCMKGNFVLAMCSVGREGGENKSQGEGFGRQLARWLIVQR